MNEIEKYTKLNLEHKTEVERINYNFHMANKRLNQKMWTVCIAIALVVIGAFILIIF